MDRATAELLTLLAGLAFIGFGFWLLFPQWFLDVAEEYFSPLIELWKGIWRD